MFTRNKIALVSVINDLANDNRVRKSCDVLSECGFEVHLIGRVLPNSPPLPPWQFKAHRMKLFFKKGVPFYLFFNLRLFIRLFFSKANLLFANDLDTLLPNFLVSKIKGIPLIYDSHELFCEVPELITNPFKRKIWRALEKFIVPKLKFCITVNDSIASILRQQYGTPFTVVRNIPAPFTVANKSRSELGLPENKRIVIMQGAGINIDRGAEELVLAMDQLDHCLLLIIGSGDVWPVLQKMTTNLKNNNVKLIDRIPKEQLAQYTAIADAGISIDKGNNPNYLNSLPNKFFDYVHAGIPIVASRLIEIEKLVNKYDLGVLINSHSPNDIAAAIKAVLDPEANQKYKSNSLKAKKELTWDTDKSNLKKLVLAAEAS